MPMAAGSCQTRAATRHAPPSPARPMTIPKNEAAQPRCAQRADANRGGRMMNAIVGTIKTLFGLFFDDGSVAVAIIGMLVALALLAHAGLLVSPVVTMVLLVGGALLLLLENVIRTAARASRPR
jgi:hypothetical protein